MRLNRWALAAALWTCVIFFSSTSLASVWSETAFAWVSAQLFGTSAMHEPSMSVLHLLADKGLHVTLFLVLATLLWRAVPEGRYKVPAILVLGLAIGSTSEFLQRFFPGRDPALRDVAINLGGTALGVLVCAQLGMLRRPAPHRPDLGRP